MMILVDIVIAVALLIPLVGIPMWLIVNDPLRERQRPAVPVASPYRERVRQG